MDEKVLLPFARRSPVDGSSNGKYVLIDTGASGGICTTSPSREDSTTCSMATPWPYSAKTDETDSTASGSACVSSSSHSQASPGVPSISVARPPCLAHVRASARSGRWCPPARSANDAPIQAATARSHLARPITPRRQWRRKAGCSRSPARSVMSPRRWRPTSSAFRPERARPISPRPLRSTAARAPAE